MTCSAISYVVLPGSISRFVPIMLLEVIEVYRGQFLPFDRWHKSERSDGAQFWGGGGGGGG
ncbi:MAG: hypothetical protein ACRCR1_05855, partial [Aeromonas sp.]